MKYDGIVIGRLFVNQHIEKDCLYHEINKYSKSTKILGIGRKPNIVEKIQEKVFEVAHSLC
ncbi:hypothetical protein [Thermoanaerobacterium thermosaccharolyticum]|jgi:putative transposase|uniref:hypothetical protein n=1 Tax=Thermoanaerobacterium thermosaccharolyticum TaxID=1517 RepID=UPI0003159AA1|nr:hypothetical protein [Thermoanaerobacterium thermosaccharolyticum]KAA5806932.1 hypothetical protein F1655_06755 [Thermoanaerobacterium thermosaccharolyticum]